MAGPLENVSYSKSTLEASSVECTRTSLVTTLPTARTELVLPAGSVTVKGLSGSVCQAPSTMSLYWCSPAGMSLVIVHTPPDLVMASPAQPLKEPAMRTVPAF